MNIRKLILGSVAVAGLSLVAAPAFADNYYSHNSTPAERYQTNLLNTDASVRARSDTNANMAALEEYDAARAAYEHALNNYDARRATYENDRARYDDQRHDYDRDRLQRWSAFHRYDRYNDIRTFRSVQLIGMTVSTRRGDRIGRIRDVDMTVRGEVTRVAIEVGRHRMAWVYVEDVRYDPRTRAVLIDLTRDQVDSLARMHQPGS